MKELLQAKRKNLELVKVQTLLEKYNIAPSSGFKIPTSPQSYFKSCMYNKIARISELIYYKFKGIEGKAYVLEI